MSTRTVRFYSNNKRLSTAVELKNGRFLQVFPKKQYYTTEERWKSFWESYVKSQIKTEVKETVAKQQSKPLTWEYKDTSKFTAPPGSYYVGDLCYALKDEYYEKVFGGQGYESGLYTASNGSFFMVDGTAWGDGCYEGNDKREYCVDAGIIGIASLDICRHQEDWDGGHLHKFKNPIKLHFKGGIFTFDSGTKCLEIDTVGKDEDEYQSDSE